MIPIRVVTGTLMSCSGLMTMALAVMLSLCPLHSCDSGPSLSHRLMFDAGSQFILQVCLAALAVIPRLEVTSGTHTGAFLAVHRLVTRPRAVRWASMLRAGAVLQCCCCIALAGQPRKGRFFSTVISCLLLSTVLPVRSQLP